MGVVGEVRTEIEDALVTRSVLCGCLAGGYLGEDSGRSNCLERGIDGPKHGGVTQSSPPWLVAHCPDARRCFLG